MSEEATDGITPRDRDTEAARRVTRRRRRIAVGVIVALVAAIGVGQLAFGVVSRVIDATGWTCGSGWHRIDDAELAEMQIIRWGTPEVRDQGVEPDEFVDLPPGLAEPSLTTPGIVDTGVYDPLLYPLDDAVVLQSDGYYDHRWVGADALTGEPLWGIGHDASGFGTVQGRFSLVAAREDGRTDLTTFDPRTAEKLSCMRLDGEIAAMTGVGDSDIAVALRSEGDDGSTFALLRIDPVAGDVVWSRPLEHGATSVVSDGQVIAVSASSVGAVATRWFDQEDTAVTAVDATDGQEIARIEPSEGRAAAVDVLTMPDGSSSTLLYGFADQEAWSDGEPEYILVDAEGSELWRVSTTREQNELNAWVTDGVLVVPDGWQLAGIDLASGDRLWRADDVSARFDDVVIMDVGGRAGVVVTDQRIEGDDGETIFVTLVIDPATGEAATYEAALRDARLTDSYLLSSTGMTRIVIPLAE